MTADRTILVTPRSLTTAGHRALDMIRDSGYAIRIGRPGEQPSEEELMSLLPGCVGYLAGVEPITARVLTAARSLRAISRNGVGVDNIDASAAERAGIAILTTPGANAQGVAELAIALMFSLVRGIPRADRTIKDGGWSRTGGWELSGRVLGIIGCGNVGSRVAELGKAIGMRVLGYDPFPPGDPDRDACVRVTLEEVLRTADVVSLHAPAQARPVIDAAALRIIKPGAWLVNTARAALVDAAALIDALDSNRLAGYAIDAYDREPPEDRRLVGRPDVIATPHIGGYTAESVDRAAVTAATNLIEALEGTSRV